VSEPLPFPADVLTRAGLSATTPVASFRAGGCDQCGNTGYFGRSAIFEVLPITESLRALVAQGATTGALHAQALADGMMPLLGDGLARVVAGVTSAEEVLRVVQDG
jgi:type II secretory ATPase GspE/PulE/Tfp pilus assembly ATPase PilB-like protein